MFSDILRVEYFKKVIALPYIVFSSLVLYNSKWFWQFITLFLNNLTLLML